MGIGGKIAAARVKAGLSQEALGEIFGVSRQAVQKWESGASVPEFERLVLICRRFGMKLDELIDVEDSGRTAEERRVKDQPNYAAMHPWDLYSADFLVEYQQLFDEGRDVQRYKRLVEELVALPFTAERETMVEALAQILLSRPLREGYAYYEPSDLDGIKACRHPGGRFLPKPDKKALPEKIKGAWLGRIAGCLLGKPLEGIRTGELNELLKATGNYPLRRYVLQKDLNEELYARISFHLRGRCWADTIDGAPADDDTNYTVMAATQILERHGRDFKPFDVLAAWVDCQPKKAYCTAERVAYLNFVNGYEPPISAVHKNPYREWIGAQIRADYYGYINPGKPEAAAEMAWRDASVSHVKNGIYGEIFVAAMLSAAAVLDDVRAVIACGLKEIPERSRLYEQICALLAFYDEGRSAEEAYAFIHARWDEHDAHHWCHTISNALIIVMALLWGRKNFGKSICLAVGCGFDTDCNGATVGSIIGMMISAERIPEEWTKAFGGELQTQILGVEKIHIDELCSLTMKHMGED
ncbi:MAG: ADP-ribosylglycohydrolase family protein [Christensenellaceae bacterium]|jgi:transcriptional regulator with XRE-family HTH domain/ADP-ribosylglycohydrolase|nr:ADP-ribosylglycohydrolase family protein [Christensenellaceae bacterium]